MAYVPMTTEELKKMVMMGKKRPMNFAYNPGPKEQDLLIIDRIKAPEVLGRLAKKEGKGTKVAAGVFEIDAKKFTIKVPKELPGLAKKLRKYLKTMDYSYKIIVLDSNGTLLESDGSEEDQQDGTPQESTASQPETKPQQTRAQDTPAEPAPQDARPQTAEPEPDISPAAQEQAAATAQERSALTERLRKLQRPISDLGTAGAPLGKAAAAVVALLKAGSLDKADTTLAKMEASLAKAQASRPENNAAGEDKPLPVAKALMARASVVRTDLDGLQGTDTEAVKSLLVQGLAALKAKDWAVADARLGEAEKAFRDASKAAADQLEQTQNSADETAATEASQAVQEDANAAVETAQEAPSAAPKSQQKWDAISSQIQAGVDKAMQAKRGDLDGINRAFNYAKSQAEAGEYDSAVAAATNTVKLLKAAASAPVTAAQDAAETVPDNVVAYRKSRIDWGKTRTGLQAELVKLKMAIDTQTKGIAGLEEIAENTGVLFDYVEELDSSLEAKLDALLGTPDGPQREKLKGEAIGIIGTYRTTLDSDFFQSVDDNGFTKTTIRSTALTALAGVETALAA